MTDVMFPGFIFISLLPSDQGHSFTTAENSNYLDILEINLGRSEQQKKSRKADRNGFVF